MLKQFEIDAARLTRIYKLVARKATGSRRELARKLGISVSHVSLYISFLRRNGVLISYDQHVESYFLEQENKVSFACGFTAEETTEGY